MSSMNGDSINYVLHKFDSDEAFELGNYARTLAKRNQKKTPLQNFIIKICSTDEHCLFCCSTSSGTSAANDRILEIKTKAALRLKQSSKRIKKRLNEKNSLADAYNSECRSFLSTQDEINMLCPGALPIFLYNGGFPIGCISIDSCGTGPDHDIAQESLKKLSQKQERQKQEKDEQEIANQLKKKLKIQTSSKKVEGNAWKLYTK